MTEDKAKTKWCPAIRLTIREDGNYKDTWAQTNRGEDISCGASTNCLGSACMAWRVTHVEAKEFQYTDQEGSVLKNREHVFCGLAGAPQ